MNSEKEPGNGSTYKSPRRKLVKIFEKGRDNWKKKCQEAKYKVKLLSNRIRYLEKRKAELKLRVKELEKELKRVSEKKNVTPQGLSKNSFVKSLNVIAIALTISHFSSPLY